MRGRFSFVETLIQSKNINLMNIYVPTKDNEQATFFQNVNSVLISIFVENTEYKKAKKVLESL